MRNLIKRSKYNSLTGLQARRLLKFQMFAMGVLAIIALFVFFVHPVLGGGLLAAFALPIIPGGNVKKSEDMTQEEKDALATIQKTMNDALKEYETKSITFEMLQKNLNDMVSDLNDEAKAKSMTGAFADQLKEINGWSKAIKSLAQKVENMEKKGFNMSSKSDSPLSEMIKEVLESEKFKDFANGRTKKSTGKIPMITKDGMSIIGNYSGGTTLISEQTQRVSENPQPRKVNMRDIMMVENGDGDYPNVTYSQITNMNRNAITLAENGALAESSFDVKEVTTGTSRIGTMLYISKRMLKSLKWMNSWLTNRIPKWIRMAEDFQILKGDGQGNNILGIMNICPNFKNVLTNWVVGAAGSVVSVASYNKGAQTLVTFATQQPLINNGANITFAAFANAPYNATFVVNKVTDKQIVIDSPYVAQDPTTVCSLVTFNVGGEFAHSAYLPTDADVLLAAQSYLTYGEYMPNCVALNPIDVFKIRVLKDTMTRYLNIITTVNGIMYIGSLPIVETTAVAAGDFVMGDFEMGASLVDFTALELEFAEDISSKIQNQIAVIVQEEVIMPIYNPFAFLQGKFADILTLITK